MNAIHRHTVNVYFVLLLIALTVAAPILWAPGMTARPPCRCGGGCRR